jgi:hypothetical protein
VYGRDRKNEILHTKCVHKCQGKLPPPALIMLYDRNSHPHTCQGSNMSSVRGSLVVVLRASSYDRPLEEILGQGFVFVTMIFRLDQST